MSYMEYLRVTPNHGNIFGTPSKTEMQIVDELQNYSRRAIHEVCTKISLMLNSQGGLTDKVQLPMITELVRLENRKRLVAFIKSNSPSPYIYFTPVSVMMLTKLNLEFNDDDGKDINDQDSKDHLASWLVSLNDSWVAQDKLLTHGRKYFIEALRINQAKQFLVEQNEPVINLLARGRYLIDKVRQVKGLDFDNLFLSATGISVDLYMEILFMVMTQWSIKSDDIKLDDIAIRSVKQFFKFTDLTEEQIEKFMKLVSFEEGDYVTLRDAMLARTGMKSDDPGNFIVFVDRPIMRFGEFFVCINNHFLALKLVSGPYRIVEQALKSTKHPNLLVDAWGAVYEQYINERMGTAFGGQYLADIKDNTGQQIIDGLLDSPHEAFPVEIKYPHWTFKARVTGSKDEMRKYVHKFARYKPYKVKPGAPIRRDKKGLGQIRQFAEKIKSGDIEARAAIKEKILTPIMVLGEEFPPDPMNRQWLEGLAASEGCTIQGAKPFILLSSEEVELLESFAEQLGVDKTVQLLSGYSRLYKTGKTVYDLPSSFKNMAIQAGVKVNNNKFLKRQLTSFEVDVKKHLKPSS